MKNRSCPDIKEDRLTNRKLERASRPQVFESHEIRITIKHFFFKYIFTLMHWTVSFVTLCDIFHSIESSSPIVLESIERPSRIAKAAFLRVSRVYMPHFQYGPCFSFFSLFSKTSIYGLKLQLIATCKNIWYFKSANRCLIMHAVKQLD